MIRTLLKTLFRGIDRIRAWVYLDEKNEGNRIGQQPPQNHKLMDRSEFDGVGKKERHAIVNLWDYLKFKEGSQAHHITHVIGFDEWAPMEEILRRVKELFGVEYKNERSLYPYLKTLVDTGLLEASTVRGKMVWKKKALLIAVVEEEMAEAKEVPPKS